MFSHSKCDLHLSAPSLWRDPRNKRRFFDKPIKSTDDFQSDYTSRNLKNKSIPFNKSCLPEEFKDYRFKYPEFLPKMDPRYRHVVAERLEREEMFKRRKVLFIPGK